MFSWGNLISVVYSVDNDLCHMVDHFIRHTGVYAYPEGIVHNEIGDLQVAHDPVSRCAADLVKAGVLDQIAGEQQAGLHIVILNITSHLVAIQTAALLHGDQETEPGGTAVRRSFRQDQLVCHRLQGSTQTVPVVTAALNEAGELFQLLTADSCLHIRDLQIVAEVTVHILVVVALGQLAILTVKAVLAEIVLTGGLLV